MNIDRKEKAIISLLIHVFILANVIFSTWSGVLYGPGDGQVGSSMSGINYFKAYTMDSNVFYGLISVFVIVYDALIVRNDRNRIPKWLYRWQYAGCVCLFMTFLIVVIFLMPIQIINGGNFLNLFSDEMFFYHLLNPIGACISLVFLSDFRFTKADNLTAMIPTVLYGVVYTVMFLLGKWPDFYGFTFGGHFWLIPIDIVVILGICYLLGFLLRKWNSKAA